MLCLQALPSDPVRRDTSRVDWTAIGLLALGLGSMQTVLEEGNSHEWFDSAFIVIASVLAVVGLATFVVRVLRSENPVVDLRVLRYRSLWAGSILSIVVGVALFGAMFAVPIFSQSIMRYTSEQTGLLLLPGALASAVTMIVASRVIMPRFDPRKVLFAGGLVLVVSLVWLGRLSPETGEAQLFWPLIVRSVGTVLMFLPLTLSAIGPIPREDVAAATGFFNLTRQLGGSVGVAFLSTILDRRVAFHRGALVAHLSDADPRTLERVAQLSHLYTSHGASESVAHAQALSTLDGLVQRQASVLGFNDTFYVVALLVLVFLPLVMLLGKPKSGASVAGAH
jgi:DHA2 family multidrug resistance protein